jgi:hypothetical protein
MPTLVHDKLAFSIKQKFCFLFALFMMSAFHASMQNSQLDFPIGSPPFAASPSASIHHPHSIALTKIQHQHEGNDVLKADSRRNTNIVWDHGLVGVGDRFAAFKQKVWYPSCYCTL